MDLGSLQNKRILFISTRFFNYEIEIANKLRDLGARVDYFDERPSNTVITKGIIRLKRSFIQKKINSYYKTILANIEGEKYDFFFLVKGESIPSFFIKRLKVLQENCCFIYYTWDSFDNNPNALSVLHFFDKKLTFDPLDSEVYKLDFRPLFYIDRYKGIGSTEKPKYKLIFLGTAHSDRYRLSTDVVNWCEKNNYSTFTYYYMQSKIGYFLKLAFDYSFKEFDYKKLNFSSLSINEIVEYYKESSIILDINHPGQRGLTMRIFEALAAGKKIITTNKGIMNYVFYDSDNIFVIDRQSIRLEKSFFESDFNQLNDEILWEMSLTGWINSVFLQNGQSHWLNKRKI